MIFRFFISIKFPLETCAEPVEAGIVFQQIYNLLEILGCVKNSTYAVSFTSFFTHHFLRAVAYSNVFFYTNALVRSSDPKYEDCIETYLGALVLIASRYNFSLS